MVENVAWSGTVTTSTSIYPSVPAKGYVIYATSFTTAASAEIVPYSNVASPGYAEPAAPCVYADNGRGITEHKSERGAVREWDVALLR